MGLVFQKFYIIDLPFIRAAFDIVIDFIQRIDQFWISFNQVFGSNDTAFDRVLRHENEFIIPLTFPSFKISSDLFVFTPHVSAEILVHAIAFNVGFISERKFYVVESVRNSVPPFPPMPFTLAMVNPQVLHYDHK